MHPKHSGPAHTPGTLCPTTLAAPVTTTAMTGLHHHNRAKIVPTQRTHKAADKISNLAQVAVPVVHRAAVPATPRILEAQASKFSSPSAFRWMIHVTKSSLLR